ncbi:MAG: hypothetical protein KBC21_02165 [Candidatus Pacebacteria bacterium]|nr:hypothetical protein [Candidatus Paceibacterota bacterium]
MSLESSNTNEQPKKPEAPESDLDIFSDRESCVVYEPTIGDILRVPNYKNEAKIGTYNTNNNWVTFRGPDGKLRTMVFTDEVYNRLRSMNYKEDSRIGVIDPNIVTPEAKQKYNGVAALEEGLKKAYVAGERGKARQAYLDNKYRV